MTRRAAIAVILCFVPSLCLRAEEPKQPKHLAEAKDLVEHLDLKNTNYEHGAGDIKWTGTRESHTDCSGFLDKLFEHSYGYDKEAFKRWFDSTRPTAARYHDAIVDGKGFTQITTVTEIRPGDILAVKYLKRKDNSGHIMLVAEKPVRMKPNKPIVEVAEEQWEINIIDSSKTGHGLTDTRHKKGADGKDHDGLGKGVTRIYADRGGKVIGFSWSVLGASEFKDPKDEHLVVGRWTENYKP
jgi:NlpC/P60 family